MRLLPCIPALGAYQHRKQKSGEVGRTSGFGGGNLLDCLVGHLNGGYRGRRRRREKMSIIRLVPLLLEINKSPSNSSDVCGRRVSAASRNTDL